MTTIATARRRKTGAGEAAETVAGQCSAQARAVGAAEEDSRSVGQCVSRSVDQSHARWLLAYWLRSKRRMLRDVREFGDQVSGEIQAIYATSISYWTAKVKGGVA